MAMALKSAITGESNIGGAGSTPIIAAGLSVLNDMLEQCGVGDPEHGDAFRNEAAGFGELRQEIVDAGSPRSWQGAASQAYAYKNAIQQARVSAIAESDNGIAKVLTTEAEQLAATRTVINAGIRYLNLCIPVAIGLGALPEGGTLASYGYQLRVVAETVPAAAIRFSSMGKNASINAGNVRSAVAGFSKASEPSPPSPCHPSGRLAVVTTGLRQSAEKQISVASKVKSVTIDLAGAAGDVLRSHGTVCQGTSTAIGDAATEHAEAAAFVRSECLELADKLRTAADMYDSTDRYWASRLKGLESIHRR